MQKQNETVVDIMAELAGYCADVRSRKISKESSFFASLGEATRLQEACLYGDIEDVLRQLRAIRGEDNAEEYVLRLETALGRDSASMESNAKSKTGTTPVIEADGADDGEEGNAAEPEEELPPSEPQVTKPQSHAPTVPEPQRTVPRAATPVKSKKPKQANSASDSEAEPAKAKTPEPTKPQVLATDANPKACSDAKPQDAHGIRTSHASTGRVVMVPIEKLYPHPAIKELYPPDPDVLEALTAEMLNGDEEDARFPIQALPADKDGRYLVYDGLTRLGAGQKAKRKFMAVVVKDFPSEHAVVAEAVRIQHTRRACNDQVLLRSVQALLDVAAKMAKAHQGQRTDLKVTSGQPCPEAESANEFIAKAVSKSVTTVKHAKVVNAEQTVAKKVLAGVLTLNAAYEEIRNKSKAGAPAGKKAKKDNGVPTPSETESSGADTETSGTVRADATETVTADSSTNGKSESTLQSEAIAYQIDQAEKIVKSFFALLGTATVTMDNDTLAIDIFTCDMAMECLIRAEMEARLASTRQETSSPGWL